MRPLPNHPAEAGASSPSETGSRPAATPAQGRARRTTGAIALAGATGIMVLSLGAFVVAATVQDAPADHRVGSVAADFSLRDSTQRRHTLGELTNGHPVLLVFSANEGFDLPLEAAAAVLAKVPQTRVVVVQQDASADAPARQLAARSGVEVMVLADPINQVAQTYAAEPTTAMPYAVLVTVDGRIADRGPLAECLARMAGPAGQ